MYIYKVKSEEITKLHNFEFLNRYFDEHHIYDSSELKLGLLLDLKMKCEKVLEDHSRIEKTLPMGWNVDMKETTPTDEKEYLEAVQIVLDTIINKLLPAVTSLEPDQFIQVSF